jgi:nuclear transcription factor Y alpha
MMSFRSHEGGFGQVPNGGAPLPWWAAPSAPQLLLYGEALGQGKLPPEPAAACREARFQVVPGVAAPLDPPVVLPPPQQPPKPAAAADAAERGSLPELLKFSVAQGEDASVCLCLCLFSLRCEGRGWDW